MGRGRRAVTTLALSLVIICRSVHEIGNCDNGFHAAAMVRGPLNSSGRMLDSNFPEFRVVLALDRATNTLSTIRRAVDYDLGFGRCRPECQSH
jgi:hypothetical protein